VGQRFPIATTRTLLRLIQNGELEHVSTQKHPVFGFEVPTQVPGVDSALLDPKDDKAAKKLAALFQKNAHENGYPSRGGPL
jgi:phosphoenolpyruvate carboxykinase (ATP)